MDTNARTPNLDLEPSPGTVDPRIKSPDDILSKLSPKKAAPASADEKVKDAARELADLKIRYDAEIAQWRDYEKRIQEWRAQVVSIVQGLKRDLATRQELVEELDRCRAALKAREDELQRIRTARANFKAAV